MVGLLGATSNVLGSAGKLAGGLGGLTGGGGEGPSSATSSVSFQSGSMDRGIDTQTLMIGLVIIAGLWLLTRR